MQTSRRKFGIPVLAASIALMAAASRPAKADLIFAITDVNGTMTASASDTGRTIEWGYRGGILFGPGLQIGYASITHYNNLFGSPDDPSLIQYVSILPNPWTGNHPDETEIFSSGENTATGPDGKPIPCASILFCTPTLDDVVYPVADITYSDGTVDHVTFQWIATPEPAAWLLLMTLVLAIGASRRLWRGKTPSAVK